MTLRKGASGTGLAAAILLTLSLTIVAHSSEPESAQDETQREGQRQEADNGHDEFTWWSSASDSLGMDIDSADGEKIGEVVEIIIDMESRRLLAIVVSTGGLLDMSKQRSLISPQDLQFDTDREKLRSNLTREQIRSAPRYRSDDAARLARVPPMSEARVGVAIPRIQENDSNRDDRDSNADQTEEGNASGKGVPVSELIGMKLEDIQGKSVGSVTEVYIDFEGGEAVGVVFSTGGFLGLGGKQALLALSELEYHQAEERLLVRLDEDQLDQVPEYKEDDLLWVFYALRARMESSGAENASVSEDTENSDRSTQSGPTLHE